MKVCLVVSAAANGPQLVIEGRTLRLVTIDDAHFELISSALHSSEEPLVVHVRRELYDEIAAELQRWEEIRKTLTAGPYADAGRLFVSGRQRI